MALAAIDRPLRKSTFDAIFACRSAGSCRHDQLERNTIRALLEARHRTTHVQYHSCDHFTRPDFNISHGANMLIIICARPSSQFVAAAALNILKVKTELGIQEAYTEIVSVVVGVPSSAATTTSRKEPKISFWKK
jgi:hypothetical protein